MKKINVNTTYHRPDGTLQPTVCAKLNKKGELVWKFVPKEAWHLKMFPNRYNGDFSAKWMLLVLYNQGISA
jgi:hypothetical protein